MIIIINFTLTIIFILIGLYFKIQNDKYINTPIGVHYEVNSYSKLRNNFNSIYLFKIKKIKNKIIKNKKIKNKIIKNKKISLAEKEVLKDFFLHYNIESSDIMWIKDSNLKSYLFSNTNNYIIDNEKDAMINLYNDIDNVFYKNNFENKKKINCRYIK